MVSVLVGELTVVFALITEISIEPSGSFNDFERSPRNDNHALGLGEVKSTVGYYQP